MKIRKEYSFSNNRQIWRLIPSDTGKLIIEERDTEKKQVFFTCLNIDSGKKIISDLQLIEKYWVSIEDIYRDIIYFHGFAKPDMPGHLGITAYDIKSSGILWQNDNYIFSFIYEDKIYAFEQQFEGRKYYSLNYLTGHLEEYTEDIEQVNLLHEKSRELKTYDDYLFPDQFFIGNNANTPVEMLLIGVKQRKLSKGPIEFTVKYNQLFFNVHEITDEGWLNNKFYILDISSEKIIFETVLNNKSNAFVPDSFFIKENLLFLLINKLQLVVYSIDNK